MDAPSDALFVMDRVQSYYMRAALYIHMHASLLQPLQYIHHPEKPDEILVILKCTNGPGGELCESLDEFELMQERHAAKELAQALPPSRQSVPNRPHSPEESPPPKRRRSTVAGKNCRLTRVS